MKFFTGLRTVSKQVLIFSLMSVTILASVLIAGSPLVEAATPLGTITYAVDSSWNDADRATLQKYIDPSGPVQKAILAVTGRPQTSFTVTLHNSTDTNIGEYYLSTRTMNLTGPRLDVFLHEVQHATRDIHMLGSNSLWEEGLARAGENTIISKLADSGYPVSADSSAHFNYVYYTYYDATNTADVAVAYNNIFGNGTSSLILQRYDQAGFAFGKLQLENPLFLSSFHEKLFAASADGGTLTSTQLKSILGSVVTYAENKSFSVWFSAQNIFNVTPPAGCRIFQRISIYTADVFCRTSTGYEIPQSGIPLTFKVYGYTGTLVMQSTSTTTSYGWASMGYSPTSYIGRIKTTVNGMVNGASVSSSYYRTIGIPETGVFGVVTNLSSGTVTISSLDGKFATIKVPLQHGAFSAPTLNGVAGRIKISAVSGSKTRVIYRTKDAAPLYVQATY